MKFKCSEPCFESVKNKPERVEKSVVFLSDVEL